MPYHGSINRKMTKTTSESRLLLWFCCPFFWYYGKYVSKLFWSYLKYRRNAYAMVHWWQRISNSLYIHNYTWKYAVFCMVNCHCKRLSKKIGWKKLNHSIWEICRYPLFSSKFLKNIACYRDALVDSHSTIV